MGDGAEFIAAHFDAGRFKDHGTMIIFKDSRQFEGIDFCRWNVGLLHRYHHSRFYESAGVCRDTIQVKPSFFDYLLEAFTRWELGEYLPGVIDKPHPGNIWWDGMMELYYFVKIHLLIVHPLFKQSESCFCCFTSSKMKSGVMQMLES